MDPTQAGTSRNPLLRGVRVLDLTRLLPGPFCTQYFAQLGAEVIKIEEPRVGDYARAMSADMFALINRGKRSVVLDLKRGEDVEALKRLAADVDVLIESFRPGVMDKLGCGYAALKAINPKLVYAALTGYGYTGPWAQRAGHDINYCGYAGVLEQTGAADGPPALSGFQMADLAGGALTCAIGILAAVHGARASGHGCFVDSAMLDGTLALQAVTLAGQRARGSAAARGGDMLTGALTNYAVYECADGKHVAMGALEHKFWANFCTAVGKPDWGKSLPMPGKAGAARRAEVEALFKTKTRDEWEALLADADACVTAILSPEEALRTEQTAARDTVQRDAAGKPEFGLPLRFVDAELPDLGPAPKLGADTESCTGG